MLNWVEKALHPSRLADLTEARISHLQAKMRRGGLAEATIKTNLAHLAAALGWAHRLGMLPTGPSRERSSSACSPRCPAWS